MSQLLPKPSEILELWNTARLAGNNSRYDRMLYIQKNLIKKYPASSKKQIWLIIGDVTKTFAAAEK